MKEIIIEIVAMFMLWVACGGEGGTCRMLKVSTNVDGQFCKYLVMCSCGLIAESSI